MRNLHIEALKHADEHRDGFCIQELKNELKLNEDEYADLRDDVYRDNSFYNLGLKEPPKKGGDSQLGTFEQKDNTLVRISYEGTFKLLEYEELQQARRSSNTAKYLAAGAMLLATIVGIIQICIALCLTQDINIADSNTRLEVNLVEFGTEK